MFKDVWPFNRHETLKGENKETSIQTTLINYQSYKSSQNTLSEKSFLFLKGVLEGLRQFLATEIPTKMMKNAFYFTLKALFYLKMLIFCLHVLVMQKNDLIRKVRLISKFATSQPVKQRIAIHISQQIKKNRQLNMVS